MYGYSMVLTNLFYIINSLIVVRIPDNYIFCALYHKVEFSSNNDFY